MDRWNRKLRRLFLGYTSLGVCMVTALSTTTHRQAAASIGERIQRSQSLPDLLDVANDLWLPTDDDLPSHLQTQRVHHEKRLRWSSQLLGKMGAAVAGVEDFPWHDSGFARAVLASSIPFQDDRAEKEGRYLREALVGLHNILGYAALTSSSRASLPDPVQEGIRRLVERADGLAPVLALPEAAEIRWACLGIFSRSNVLDNHHDETKLMSGLDERVTALPFDLVPQVIDWEEVFPGEQATSRLQDEIPFNFDTIVTRTGAAVTERRGTAWIAEDGIGALAYSGKLMRPQLISGPIRAIMRVVEDRVVDSRDYPSPFFDCALCNHYPDGESACKFHTDPEHGSHWERLNCVIAAGSPRRFAFRPIPGHSTWSEWETSRVVTSGTRATCDPNVPAVITLFPGDVAKMWGSCNDDFHHAVYSDSGQARPGEREVSRVSLVLKRSIPNSSGLRGHRLPGEGRRSRRKSHSVVQKTREIPTGQQQRRRRSKGRQRNGSANERRE